MIGQNSLSAIVRDAKGEVLAWTYGSREARPGLPVVTEFMVPPGAASLEPRAKEGPTLMVE